MIHFLAFIQIFFLACHPSAGKHMADFANTLEEQSISCDFLAAESAYDIASKKTHRVEKFYSGERPLKDLDEEELVALTKEVASRLDALATKVIADVGSLFSTLVFNELNRMGSRVIKIAYYDNPEPFVPGGYSTAAATLIRAADGVLFANTALKGFPIYDGNKKELNLSSKSSCGLGYFPFDKVNLYRELRKEEEQTQKRADFFTKAELEDRGQKLFVYIGGANEVYEKQAFPAFKEILSASTADGMLDDYCVLLQRHPRASDTDIKAFKKLDTATNSTFVVSPVDFDSALAIADIVGYYQTSISSFFPLIKIPAFQIGHEPFNDVLIRNNLCEFVGSASKFKQILNRTNQAKLPSPIELSKLYKILGINPEWSKKLTRCVLYHFRN